jgi:tetratricopeptide (TPR) repeat protein
MPKESQIDPRKNFVPRWLPWLVGGAMLVVYGLTLNHWVNLSNIFQVAAVSGWLWQPQLFNPLTFLITLPFRLVPAPHIPIAINFLSALCAAATLAVLARSVAILPHDRTDIERWRERTDFAFLTGWVAWVPPLAAVIFAGFQLAFWENATSFTGEGFELLWFAVILWQLLEYRLDEREGHLYVAALLYGAGLTENWAMLGFFPLFLVMIIWLRKLDFFDAGFLLRMALCGFAGLLLLFLLPLKIKLSGAYPLTFWETLKPGLRANWMVIQSLGQDSVRHALGLMALTSLLPAFVMAIRWSSSFGDSSRMGAMLVNYLMHGVNAILLAVLVWVTFDPPFSPHQLIEHLGFNAPGLSLYYIVAVCIGYYTGYCLLVFGKDPIPSRRNTRPDPALPQAFLWLCPVIVTGTLVLLIVLGGMLVYKNAPIVRAANDDSLLKYARFSTQKLPAAGAILLCDSDNPAADQPVRAYLLQAELARAGRARNIPVVDTTSLSWPIYHHYLHERFPKIWPDLSPARETNGLSPVRVLGLLNQLSQSNDLYYANPSFGYYFEQFYQEPHGLVYALKPVPKGTLLPPALATNLIAENESFWTGVLAESRPAIELAQRPWDPGQQSGPIPWLLMHLHIPLEPNHNALRAGLYYSHSLNSLGVEVQRAGHLDQAAVLFADACDLNTNNVVAGINLNFNKTLRAGSTAGLALSRVTSDQFGIYNNWNEVLAANGPFDETSFCFANGVWLMQGGMMRQAAVAFTRVRQLLPDNLAARLFLAQIYIVYREPDQALEALHDPITRPVRFALTEFNSKEVSLLAAAAHFEKNETGDAVALLESEIARHPDDETLLLAASRSFILRGLYSQALGVINRKLARTPNDPQWLYGKGVVSLQVSNYDDAITALNHFLDLRTNSPDALYNRGLAYFQSGRLDAARTDFRRVQSTYTNSFRVAYALGEIARHRQETNEAVRNYQIYLENAPTNSAELKAVRQHLSEFDGK